MKDCVFCNIGKEEIIIKTKYCVVIPDKYPVSKGHVLVVPKKHYKKITQIPDKELFDIIKTIKLMEKRMLKKLKSEGIDLRQNYRPFIPESRLRKEHIHFHLIPRSFNDLIYKKKGNVERKEISEKEKKWLIGLLG